MLCWGLSQQRENCFPGRGQGFVRSAVVQGSSSKVDDREGEGCDVVVEAITPYRKSRIRRRVFYVQIQGLKIDLGLLTSKMTNNNNTFSHLISPTLPSLFLPFQHDAAGH